MPKRGRGPHATEDPLSTLPQESCSQRTRPPGRRSAAQPATRSSPCRCRWAWVGSRRRRTWRRAARVAEQRSPPEPPICRKCNTDVSTGQRLPLGQRLRRTTLRTWTLDGGHRPRGGAAHIRRRPFLPHSSAPASRRTRRRFSPFRTSRSLLEEWAERLLGASSNANERLAARDKLVHGGALASAAGRGGCRRCAGRIAQHRGQERPPRPSGTGGRPSYVLGLAAGG